MTPIQEALADRYEFLSVLGEGGFATVFAVKHVQIGRVEALKAMQVPMGTRDSTEFFGRFEQEARIIASLDHPHIVKLFDFGIAASVPWFTMQLIAGEPLSSRIEAQPPLTEAEAVAILTPILDALAYAHDRGIVHRDVKPANILLDRDNRPFLTDFGLAKPRDTPHMTRTNVVMGTPHYLAPEQARGKGLDHRSDIYAVAVTLYEMLTGHCPFAAFEGFETVVAKLTTEPDSPRASRKDMSRAMEAAILKGLERYPDKRFQTAREMAEALALVISDPEPPGEPSADPQLVLAQDSAEPATVKIDVKPLPPESPSISEKTHVLPREGLPESEPRAVGTPGEAVPSPPLAPRRSRALIPIAATAASLAVLGLVAFLRLSSVPLPANTPKNEPLPSEIPSPRAIGPTPTAEKAAPATPVAILKAPAPQPRVEARREATPAAEGPARTVARPAFPPLQTSDGDPASLSGMPEVCAGTKVKAIVVVGPDGHVLTIRRLSDQNSECWLHAEKFIRTILFEPAKTAEGMPVTSLPLALAVVLGDNG